MKQYLLTTSDNPFNPQTEFDSWYQYDTSQGYHTLSYLNRIVSKYMSVEDIEPDVETMNRAIDEIVHLNVLGLYEKIEIFE